MTHSAIIDQLSQLAPQLKAATSPEDVLVKYARDKNLAPAQLERMGQVYNIAKTLNFMDKSASRGATFRVLDTAEMLRTFTSYKAKEAKAVDDSWSGWFADDTVKSASTDFDKSAKIVEEDGAYVVYSEDGSKKLSKPLSEADAKKRLRQIEYFKHVKSSHVVPNIMAMTQDEVYSPHVDVQEDTKVITPMSLVRDELRKEAADKFELESTMQVIEDASDEFRKVADELLSMHRIENIPFATMERDALHIAGPGIKSACDAIANYFSQKGWTLPRHDTTAATPKLVRDTHNIVPILKSAYAALETRAAGLSYMEHLKEAAKAAPTRLEDLDPADFHNKGKNVTQEEEDEESQGNTNTPPQRGDGGSKPKLQFPKEPGSAAGTSNATPKHPVEPAQSAGIGRSAPNADISMYLASNGLGSKETADGNGKKPEGKPVDDVKVIVDSIKQLYNPDTYVTGQTKSFLDNILKTPTLPSRNTKQKNVDMAVSDVSRVTTLQRMMLNDPIIGEADPETVVSLYNTLAKANPEVAADPNLLRFALREALQYDAVPLHTYKDLVSMGKDRAESDLKTDQLTDKRYTI